MEELAINLIKMGKDWLTEEYGSFNSLTTEIEIEQDITDTQVQEVVKHIKTHEDIDCVFSTKYSSYYTVTLQFK